MKAINDVSVVDFSDTPPDMTVYVKGFEDMTLTTLDNPFSPFDDFERWTWYDERQGYNTNQLIARLVGVTSEFQHTKLGKEFDDRFYYSTIVDVVHKSTGTPYIIVSTRDYSKTGSFNLYSPTIFAGETSKKPSKPA